MRAMKAVYGLWADIQIGQLNKLLKPFGCKLEKTTSKKWGDAVSITAAGDGGPPGTIAIADLSIALLDCIGAIDQEVQAAGEDDHPSIAAHLKAANRGREALAKWGINPPALAPAPSGSGTGASGLVHPDQNDCFHEFENGSDFAKCVKCHKPKFPELHST